MTEQYQVLILGHGEMGRAMEHWLRPHHAVAVWVRRPPAGKTILLEEAAARTDVVLFCLPAAAHHELAARLKPRLRPQALCLSIAKGLDEAGRTAAQALTQALGEQVACGVLYGPMISEEILAGKPAFADYGSPRAETFGRVQALFRQTPLALRYTADVPGISWSAVLKNVYAILFGVADGLDLGDNMRGYLAAAAVHEIAQIVEGLGGVATTPYRLAGLGDLITTATSRGSHHHELGRQLARGATALEGEGVHTAHTIRARALFDYRPYPLFRLIVRLLDEPGAARALLGAHLAELRREANARRD